MSYQSQGDIVGEKHSQTSLITVALREYQLIHLSHGSHHR